MTEKLVLDTAEKAAKDTAEGLATAVRDVWTVMDAASEKRQPTQYLGEQAIRSIQGRE